MILAGALIARAACRAFGVEAALVSESDILDGIALWLADGCPPLASAAAAATRKPQCRSRANWPSAGQTISLKSR